MFENPNSINFAPWYKKFIINLTGPLACIIFAFAVMGIDGLNETVKSWTQFYWLLTDYSTSFDAYNIINKIYNDGGLIVLTAMISAKMAGFNLLPLQLLSGGGIILALREAITGQDISQKTKEITAAVSLVIMLAFAIIFISRALL